MCKFPNTETRMLDGKASLTIVNETDENPRLVELEIGKHHWEVTLGDDLICTETVNEISVLEILGLSQTRKPKTVNVVASDIQEVTLNTVAYMPLSGKTVGYKGLLYLKLKSQSEPKLLFTFYIPQPPARLKSVQSFIIGMQVAEQIGNTYGIPYDHKPTLNTMKQKRKDYESLAFVVISLLVMIAYYVFGFLNK